MNNMYSDSVKQWNVIVGCLFNCVYCEKSFKAQMKRQKHNCEQCYLYTVHFHPERLDINFNKEEYETTGDQFIWVASSCDVSFAKEEWIDQIWWKIEQYPNRKFFFQTKDPRCFERYNFPELYGIPYNIDLGITLETNRDKNYNLISKAPPPSKRKKWFDEVDWEDIRLTLEPILDFDLKPFVKMIEDLEPKIVYVGYDTKKSIIKTSNGDIKLPEPKLEKTESLIDELKDFTIVKTKFMREAVI